MKLQEILLNYDNVVLGDFEDLDVFNFSGVYIICDMEDDIVYVGSAYARTIKIRLQQYLRPSDTGNTLGKTIAKKLSRSKTYNEKAKERIKDAIKIIKNVKYAQFHIEI